MGRVCLLVALVGTAGLAVAQSPAELRAEFERLADRAQNATSRQEQGALFAQALQVARRCGDPHVLLNGLTWAWNYPDRENVTPEQRDALLKELLALAFGPQADDFMRRRGYRMLWGAREREIGDDPDRRSAALAELEPRVQAEYPDLAFTNDWLEIATLYAQDGRPKEAWRIIAGVLAGAPASAPAWKALAELYRAMGDERAAFEAKVRQAQLDRRSWGRTTTRDAVIAARDLADTDWLRMARQFGAEKAVAPLMEDVLALTDRGLLYDDEDDRRMVRALRATAHIVRGLARAQDGQRAAAEADFGQAVDDATLAKWGRGQVEANEAWAELLIPAGDLKEADSKLSAAAELREGLEEEERGRAPMPFALYAQLRHAQGQVKAAIQLQEQALKAAQAADDAVAQAEALAALAALYHEEGRGGEALRAGERAAELAEKLPFGEADQATRSLLAAIYYDLGAVEQAEAVEQGLQHPQRDASTNWAAALRRRAQAEYRAGRYEEAIKLLKQARQVDDTLQRKLALVDDLNGLAACYLALARQRAQP